MSSSASERTGGRAGVMLGGAEAARLADLLERLAELPSTPGLVAEEARYRAAEVSWALPEHTFRPGPGQRGAGAPVLLDELAATGIAGLLELLSGMPSTPPGVADDALAQADALWALIAAEG
jgi:hypothetical protein